MVILSINCWVRSHNRINFPVKISKTETVLGLKKVIKNELSVTFRDVDADTLALYKARDPIPVPYEENLRKITLLEHAELLENGDKLLEIFLRPLPRHHIHIIVDAPSMIVFWLRGFALGDSSQVSIRTNASLSQLKRAIKGAVPDLRNEADHNICLYRISGDDDELQESLNKTGSGELLQGTTLAPNFLGVPVIENLRVVVDVYTESTQPLPLEHLDSGGADPIRVARVDFIQAPRANESSYDGLKPSAFRETQRAKDTWIPCSRPRDPEELIPVTLLHPVFGQFLDDSKTGIMTEDDNQFVGKLANVLSDLYAIEWERAKVLGVVLRGGDVNFDLLTKFPRADNMTGGHLSIDDADLPPYCIAEFKNEVESTSTSEPYMQAIANYFEATKTYASIRSKLTLPCFLLVAFGPYIVFAGAVWNLRPVVQVLSTPLAFHYHSTDTTTQLTIARHMAAWRKALRTLKAYYEDLSKGLANENQSHNMLFPCYTEFKSLSDDDDNKVGSTQTICYTKQLDKDGEKEKLIFFGTLEGDPTARICIKFTRRYSKEAHLHCAKSGFAPKLRGFEVIPGGWYMVVMDDLVGYDLLADFPYTERLPRSVLEAIGTQLKTLHARQMVHGDVRDTNVFIKKDDRTKFMIIDFDWAGVENVVRYPPYVNHTDVQRPEGARDGLFVKAAHDLEMLAVVTEAWAARDS